MLAGQTFDVKGGFIKSLSLASHVNCEVNVSTTQLAFI